MMMMIPHRPPCAGLMGDMAVPVAVQAGGGVADSPFPSTALP
jgi:hypothetical protein